MTFSEICEREKKESEGLRKVLEKLENVKGKRVLLFAHDDPDRITSAAIIHRVLEKGGAKSIHRCFPEGFDVLPSEIEAEKKFGPFDLFICLDKGTKEATDRIAETGLETIIIDHHFLFGEPKKSIVFNSLMTNRPYCSASYLCLIVATLLDRAEEIDEYDALIGLKADFCIDPTVGNLGSDFVRPFVEEVKAKWENLFAEVEDMATLFDTTQRAKTTLLSQIAEVYFAVTGGAFQYFYPEDKIVGKFNQPTLCFDEDMKLEKKIRGLKKIRDLDEFFSLIQEKKAWKRCFELFQGNWKDVVQKMETAAPLGAANGATIYLFTSDLLPLIPMVGGIALAAKLKKNDQPDGIIFMVNTERTSQGKLGTHFSLRGTSEKIHVGKICKALAERLNEIYAKPEEISGGGHPRAGECRTRNAEVPHMEALFVGVSTLM